MIENNERSSTNTSYWTLATAGNWSGSARWSSIGLVRRRKVPARGIRLRGARRRGDTTARGSAMGSGHRIRSSGCRRIGSMSIAPMTAELMFRLQLEALPSGQVGVFPEQRENWDWIARQVRRAKPQADEGRGFRVLNLFAYTGGSTLAAAAAGAEVVHIDAAQNIVDRARANAELSGLADRPIRWIAEDAVKFCRREVKRGNKYDAVILDPPSYGHGPKGEVWKIENDLLPLLKLCGELTSESRAFVLVTCHSPGIGPAELGGVFIRGHFWTLWPAAGDGGIEFADGGWAGGCRAVCLRGGRSETARGARPEPPRSRSKSVRARGY